MSTTTTYSPSESAVDSPAMSADMTEQPKAFDMLNEPDAPLPYQNRAEPGRAPGAELFPSVAFIGRAGAGKTSGAQYLRRNFGYVQYSFATLLKQIAHQIWGEGAERDRSKLQPLGTLVRDIDPDAWVNALIRSLALIREPVVIDDCRFPNEYWTLKERGFSIIRVEADEEKRVDRLQKNGKFQSYEQLSHISETALDDIDADWVVSNNYERADYEQKLWDVLNRELTRS